MKPRRHRLIVIEGISGSGKTEISKRLARTPNAHYYITSAGMFRKYRAIADKTLSLEARFLFYLSSVVQASWEMTKLLETKDVICAKYIWTTICYHTRLIPTVGEFVHFCFKPAIGAQAVWKIVYNVVVTYLCGLYPCVGIVFFRVKQNGLLSRLRVEYKRHELFIFRGIYIGFLKKELWVGNVETRLFFRFS